MYVRTVKRPKSDNRIVQIVESFRSPNGYIGKRILQHIGSANVGPELDKLLDLAELNLEVMRAKHEPALFPPEHLAELTIKARKRYPKLNNVLPIANSKLLHETHRLIVGFHEVFNSIYRRMRLHNIWSKRHKCSAQLFLHEVLMGLFRPGKSKLEHANHSSCDTGYQIPVEKFYRMMDLIDEKRIEKISQLSWQAASRLQEAPVNVLLFDTTSLYFESTKEDKLRKKGFSKDGKKQNVQVVLALLMTEDDLPVGYQLFPGNTSDVTTVLPALQDIRKQHNVTKVVFVSDAGMASQNNLQLLTEAGHDYVVAARLRNLEQKIVAKVTDLTNYSAEDEEKRRVYDLKVKGRRLVVSYCPKRARRNRAARNKAVEKAQNKLKNKKVEAHLRFVKYEGKATLDEKAIAKDEKFDGLHGVWTNQMELPARMVRARYADLWKIENGFRLMKHDLRMRPIYHWTEKRVRAHVAIRFCGFVLLRHLMWLLRLGVPKKFKLSERIVLDELERVQASVIRYGYTKTHYLLPSAPTQIQKQIYQSLALTLPTHFHEFPEYLGKD